MDQALTPSNLRSDGHPGETASLERRHRLANNPVHLSRSRRLEDEMEAPARRQKTPDHDQLVCRTLPEEIDVYGENLVEALTADGKVG